MDSNNFNNTVLAVARCVVGLLIWLFVGVGIAAIFNGWLDFVVMVVLFNVAYALELTWLKRRGE